MSGRGVRRMLAAIVFAAAAACFALGLAGRVSPWVAAVLASLTLLTVGFYLAGAGSGRGEMEAVPSAGARCPASEDPEEMVEPPAAS